MVPLDDSFRPPLLTTFSSPHSNLEILVVKKLPQYGNVMHLLQKYYYTTIPLYSLDYLVEDYCYNIFKTYTGSKLCAHCVDCPRITVWINERTKPARATTKLFYHNRGSVRFLAHKKKARAATKQAACITGH